MKKMENKNKIYEAQALAIAMVIMVVSSIVAMSVYFRSQKDKTLTLEERASAEALEISDLIINKLTQYPIQDVIAKISDEENEEPFDYELGTTPPLKENFSTTEISDLLSQLGTQEDIRNLGICSINNENEQDLNEYQLTIRQANPDTFFEIRAGQVWSLPIKGYEVDPGCQIALSFEVRGDSGAGFVISKAYSKKDPVTGLMQYKEYTYDDIESYCFSSSGECNSQGTNFFGTWENYDITQTNNSLTPIDLNEEKDGYTLDEIRIKAVGGTVGLKYKTTTPNCEKGLRMIHLRVTANCYGVYRGKEVLIPEKKWHNTLFDYAVFNGQNSI